MDRIGGCVVSVALAKFFRGWRAGGVGLLLDGSNDLGQQQIAVAASGGDVFGAAEGARPFGGAVLAIVSHAVEMAVFEYAEHLIHGFLRGAIFPFDVYGVHHAAILGAHAEFYAREGGFQHAADVDGGDFCALALLKVRVLGGQVGCGGLCVHGVLLGRALGAGCFGGGFLVWRVAATG